MVSLRSSARPPRRTATTRGVFPEMRDWTPGSAASSTEYDVAVVGGGLVGSALAWGLARARQRVILFDEGDLAPRGSRGNFGLGWVPGKGLGMTPYSFLALISA